MGKAKFDLLKRILNWIAISQFTEWWWYIVVDSFLLCFNLFTLSIIIRWDGLLTWKVLVVIIIFNRLLFICQMIDVKFFVLCYFLDKLLGYSDCFLIEGRAFMRLDSGPLLIFHSPTQRMTQILLDTSSLIHSFIHKVYQFVSFLFLIN